MNQKPFGKERAQIHVYNNYRSGTRNGNSAGSGQTRPQPVTGRESVGRGTPDSTVLGARPTISKGTCANQATGARRVSAGGQASLGVSGLPQYPGCRRWTAPVAAQAKAEVATPAPESKTAPARVVPFSCRVPRSHVRGLSTGQYVAMERVQHAEAARAAKSQPTPEPAPVAPAGAETPVARVLTVKLSSDRLRIFERIAKNKNRPVKSIIGECMAGCAIQLARAEAQAMRNAAAASDERERSGYYNHLDPERGPAAPGYVEIQLAVVG
jgi:hypothetical protein